MFTTLYKKSVCLHVCHLVQPVNGLVCILPCTINQWACIYTMLNNKLVDLYMSHLEQTITEITCIPPCATNQHTTLCTPPCWTNLLSQYPLRPSSICWYEIVFPCLFPNHWFLTVSVLFDNNAHQWYLSQVTVFCIFENPLQLIPCVSCLLK